MKKGKKNSLYQGGPRNLIIFAAIFAFVIALMSQLTEYARHTKFIPYSEFLTAVDKKNVKKVHINGKKISGLFQNGGAFETVVADTPNMDLLRKHNVEVDAVDTAAQGSMWYMVFLAIMSLFAVLAWFFFWRSSRGSSGAGSGPSIFSMGKSRAKMFMPSTIKDTFESVAGAHEAKEELKDVVDFLKDPERYKRLGAKITRGLLLVGEPGNGKTLLAKAVAGEANCPFFSISGSDFIEVFVGVGASRVRDLFTQARKQSPSIVFIDEIDAVGRHRGSGQGGGNDEREQTLNQLLTEMDGFQTNPGSVIVLGATNRPDVLDKALLRPGRFDRRVVVPYPDLHSREEILRLHSRDVKLADEVDLRKVARGTPGFTGADLANLINEAALLATKLDKVTIEMNDFEEARDKVLVGKQSKTKVLSEKERRVTAYHEAGHSLIRLFIPEHTEPLHKVTIMPRGLALGITWSLPEEEKYTNSQEEIEAFIAVCMGGRAAEELIFNSKMSGASNDFEKATKAAREMICSFGMHPEVGMVVYGQEYKDFSYSQQTAAQIDHAVKSLLDNCYQRARTLLEENRDKLELLAQALLERETMYAIEIYQLLGIRPRIDHRF